MYKMHHYDILAREEITSDDLIDAIEGNRRYVKCLYVYNKIDTMFLEQLEYLFFTPKSVLISAHEKINLDGLLESIWDTL